MTTATSPRLTLETSDGDAKLLVPLSAIAREFECPICVSTIQNCYMTPCGHNFCDDCIKECINREHVCPMCRAPCTKDRLIRNIHCDKIISILVAEKDEASRKYFEKLIARPPDARFGLSPASGDVKGFPTDRQLTPIEHLFQKVMRKSLVAYDDHYSKMRRDYEMSVVRCQQNAAAEMANVRAIKLTRIRQLEMAHQDTSTVQAELEESLQSLRDKNETDLAALTEKFDASIEALLASYETYLTKSTPTPSFLPFTVTLVVKERGLRFDGVTVEVTHKLSHILAALIECLRGTGLRVAGLAEGAYFTTPSGFDDGVVAEDTSTMIRIDDSVTSAHALLHPRSVLTFVGTIELEEACCFSLTFEPGKAMDYFTCKDCNMNWVCTTCASTCHTGHNLMVYLQAHVPTWACCYCAKKGVCKIKHASSKKAGATGAGPSTS